MFETQEEKGGTIMAPASHTTITPQDVWHKTSSFDIIFSIIKLNYADVYYEISTHEQERLYYFAYIESSQNEMMLDVVNPNWLPFRP